MKDTFSSILSNLGLEVIKVSKGATIRNRYNQVPHLIQDATNSQLDTKNES